MFPFPDYIATYTAPDVPNWFKPRLAAAELTFALNIAAALGTDIPVSGTVATAPSGSGELSVSSFTYANGNLSVLPTGGQPTRIYTYDFVITGISGSVYPFTVQQGTLQVLPTDMPQVAPVAGLSMPITWNTGAPALLVALGLVGTGTDQITALLLPAFSNSISSCPSPVGFILNGDTGEGVIAVDNQDPTNSAPIYPPVGAQFLAGGVLYAVNDPFYLGPAGAEISFKTNSSATLWSVA